jgi:predicted Holliday junction resolvase-like endonuclease
VKTTKELAVYVGQTFKQGSEIEEAIKTLELADLVEPAAPPETAPAAEKKIWETRLTQFIKREEIRADNVKTLHSLVWGQCSDAMMS